MPMLGVTFLGYNPGIKWPLYVRIRKGVSFLWTHPVFRYVKLMLGTPGSESRRKIGNNSRR